MNESESFMKINKFGDKIWKTNDGKFHRLDGPAIEFNDGYKEWWFEGRIHREDGPAILYKNGGKSWFLNDILYRSKEEYFNSLSDEAKAKCLFSEDFLNG